MMPSEIIAWECGSCTFTNEGSEPGPCLMCRTERPRRKAIVAGATAGGDGVGNCAGPPVAQEVPVVLLAAVAGVAGATARDGADSRAGRPAVAGPPVAQVAKSPALAAEVGAPAAPAARKWLTKRAIKSVATARVVFSAPTPAIKLAATAPPVAKAPAAPAPGVAVLATPPPAQKLTMGLTLNSVLEVVESSGTFVDPNIVGSDVEIVGTGESQRGRSCGEHNVCGTAVVRVGGYVCFGKARFAWRDGTEEDVVEVFHVAEGRKTCKVGYLAKHLAFRADRYDGLCARITEVYSGDRTVCDNAAKRLKFHRNIGCCVAVIIGMKDMFAL